MCPKIKCQSWTINTRRKRITITEQNAIFVQCFRSSCMYSISLLKGHLFKFKQRSSDQPMLNDLSMNTVAMIYTYLATGSIFHMPYVDNVAPDQPVHLHSLTRGLHCILKSWCNIFLQINRQCSSQIRVCRCAGLSWAALSS